MTIDISEFKGAIAGFDLYGTITADGMYRIGDKVHKEPPSEIHCYGNVYTLEYVKTYPQEDKDTFVNITYV